MCRTFLFECIHVHGRMFRYAEVSDCSHYNPEMTSMFSSSEVELTRSTVLQQSGNVVCVSVDDA